MQDSSSAVKLSFISHISGHNPLFKIGDWNVDIWMADVL